MRKLFITLFSLLICTASLFSVGCGKNGDENSESSSTGGASMDREVGVEWDEENWG